MEGALYSMIQPKGSVYIVPVITILFLLGFIAVMIGATVSLKRTNILIGNREIIIHSFPYGKKIPVENILVNEIKAINLNDDKEYGIMLRTNGISLPNFRSGWMKLKNGKKALAFVTGKEKVLLMPTKDYVVLFSMEKIEEFIGEMKSMLNSESDG
jgi:hypothetical protein